MSFWFGRNDCYEEEQKEQLLHFLHFLFGWHKKNMRNDVLYTASTKRRLAACVESASTARLYFIHSNLEVYGVHFVFDVAPARD